MNKEEIHKERSAKIAFIRLLAMIMIIICHILQYYGNALCQWFNVGVQLFFLISGFLYGTKEIDSPIDFYKKVFRRILIPYWVFLIVAIALYAFFSPENFSLFVAIRALFCSATFPGLGHLWFVGYILFCYFLTPILYWFRKYLDNRSIAIRWEGYLGLFILIQVLGFFFNSYFMPDRVVCYVIGFAIPNLCSNMPNKTKSVWAISLVLLAALVSIGRVILVHGASPFSMPEKIVNAYVRYSHLLLGLGLFTLLYHWLPEIKYNIILIWSDKYSYPVYLVHLLFILSPFSLMALTRITSLNVFFILIATVLSAVLLSRISSLIETRFLS